MANWNGSYFGSGVNHNYNVMPTGFTAENPQVYQNGTGNWTYFQVNPEIVSATHTGQQLAAIFPTASGSVYGSSIPHSIEGTLTQGASDIYLSEKPLPYFDSQEATFAMAASSSLTATAGEFVPRSCAAPSNNQNGSFEETQGNHKKIASEARPSSTNTYNRERGGQNNKRSGNNDARYFQSNRGASSGYNRDYNASRRGGWGSPQYAGNQRSFSMEDSKNQDRQRLLAEAAAFLTPSVQETGSVSCNDTVNRSSEQKHIKDNLGNTSKGRDLSSQQKTDNYYNQNKSDNSNRVFTNSRYTGNYAQQDSSRWRNYDSMHHHGFDTQPSNNYQLPKNENYTLPETFGTAHNVGKNFQGRSNTSHFGNASRYCGDGSNRSSPRKEAFHLGTNEGGTDDEASQRERLTEQLTRGTLECLVCCDRVRQHDPIWSCTNCYHVLHLKCIKKWAKSSKADSGWRCPACQNVTQNIPHEYRCFCGKVREPEWNRQDAAHTCGEVCRKSRTDKRPDCVHRCTLLCHPGPCPPCVAQVTRSCGCGKTTKVVKCGSEQALLCDDVCGKSLNCGVHQCTKTCHVGECGDCEQKVKQVCFCAKESHEVACTAETSSVSYFSCGGTCDRSLACGNHNCSLKCHNGPCAECQLTPEKVTHCSCGKTELTPEQCRKSCMDPIPTCGNVCGKKLPCGQPSNPHMCKAVCHTGPCPSCPMSTFVRCRCGNMDREIPCQELTTKADDARCEKKCTKKRACGKHKCNQLCCIDLDHVCPLVCNHPLSCGKHRCEEPCHRGHCQPCWRTSFEELYCECGSSVLFPPIPCGTRRPECNRPCSRQHACDHPALHNCHSQPNCPPCTVLMQKYCYGKHELRKSVPCHQTELSCGLPCNEPLSCGRHRCIFPCHKGACLKDGRVCMQPCTTPRTLCGHKCAAPCHDGPCPDSPCKEMVKVTCECGHRSMSRACSDNVKEYQRIATALLASKMADMQLGHSVDIGDFHGSQSARNMSLKTLDCNEECKLIERNRRLAISLQIRNPDLSAKLTPRYSEFMRQWAKKDSFFCNMVHEKLTELVQLAKQSKQKSRSYSFDSMNRDKRHFIHEYCEHFGCESMAYDQEPKRNVVATASRDKAWLPGMSLLEVIQRESGQRKVPKPVINTVRTPLLRPKEVAPVTTLQSQATKSNHQSSPKREQEEIDFFDFTSKA